VLKQRLRRTGRSARRTLLVDRAVSARRTASRGRHGCLTPTARLRGDRGGDARGPPRPASKPASEKDCSTEIIDACLRPSSSTAVDGAITHIERFGSPHTDRDSSPRTRRSGENFSARRSAIVLHKRVDQCADGGGSSVGAAADIRHGRFHARGPVGRRAN